MPAEKIGWGGKDAAIMHTEPMHDSVTVSNEYPDVPEEWPPGDPPDVSQEKRASSPVSAAVEPPMAHDNSPRGLRGGDFLPPERTVTLYLNRSAESEQAFSALADAQISFRAVPAPRRRVPTAQFGDLSYRGLAGIQELAETIGAFKSALLQKTAVTMPHLLQHADPQLKRRMMAARAHHLKEARAVLEQLRKSKR